MTVVEPLSRTVAPRLAAAFLACSRRRLSTSAGSAPSSRPSSPACGVSRVGASRARSSLRAASRVSPSASTSTGTSLASTAASRSAASSSVPMPGPTTQAWTRPAARTSSPAGMSCPVTVITDSGQSSRTTATAGAADTSRTIPAPPRMAPPTASAAAPVNRSLPATIPTTPRRYLSESSGGRGSRAPTSLACIAIASGASRYGPRPMSISSTTPACRAPGSISRPGFRVPNVTVTPASIAAPSTTPVSASTPLGRSTATTTAGERAASPAREACGSRRPPRPPMPSSPSRIRSAAPRAAGTAGSSGPACRPPAARSAARPASCTRDPAVTASTVAPRPASRAPA